MKNKQETLFEWCPQPKTSAPTDFTRIAQNLKRSKLLYAIPLTLMIAVLAGFLVFLSTYVGPGPVNIEITTDKQSYLPGEEIQFQIYVNNPQIWRVPYPTEMSYALVEPNVGRDIMYPQPHPTFALLSKVFYDNYTWDQMSGVISQARTQVQPGNYTLTVAFGGPVSYGQGGSCTVEIKSES